MALGYSARTLGSEVRFRENSGHRSDLPQCPLLMLWTAPTLRHQSALMPSPDALVDRGDFCVEDSRRLEDLRWLLVTGAMAIIRRPHVTQSGRPKIAAVQTDP